MDNKKLHITFLSQLPVLPNCGGIERVSHLLAEQFSRNHVTVSFAHTELSKDANPISESNQNFFPHNNPDSSDDFKAFLKTYQVDLVINQNLAPSNYPFLAAAKSVGVKVISVLHNRPFPYNGYERKAKLITPANSWTTKILKLFGILFPSIYGIFRDRYDRKNYMNIMTYSDKLYLLSDRFIPRILQHAPALQREKLDSINNPNTFSLTNKDISKEKLVIWVGRLSDPQKNGIDFIKVWKQFHQQHPDWKAFMLGEGPERKKYEKVIKSNDIHNLTMLGNRQDIQSFYTKAQFLCMTSLYEGWPMVLSEAMANECVPVLFDTFESAHDLISNGTSGLILKPFSTSNMANEMSSIIRQPHKLEAMQKAAKLAIENFTPEKIASIWLKKINELLNP